MLLWYFPKAFACFCLFPHAGKCPEMSVTTIYLSAFKLMMHDIMASKELVYDFVDYSLCDLLSVHSLALMCCHTFLSRYIRAFLLSSYDMSSSFSGGSCVCSCSWL